MEGVYREQRKGKEKKKAEIEKKQKKKRKKRKREETEQEKTKGEKERNQCKTCKHIYIKSRSSLNHRPCENHLRTIMS